MLLSLVSGWEGHPNFVKCQRDAHMWVMYNLNSRPAGSPLFWGKMLCSWVL